jgi:hypothetical protein
VNALRVLLLTLVFALSMLFLVQNTQVLDTRASLMLDLWLVELSSPQIAFYVFVSLCFILGIIFGAITFSPGNRESREKLKLLRLKIKNLTQEIIGMQKKQDTHEQTPAESSDELQEQETTEGFTSPPEQQTIEEDAVIKPGGTAGKAALIGVFALFILLTALYFFVDQRLSDFQNRMDLTVQNSALAVDLAQRLEQDNEKLKEEVSMLSSSLMEHEKEISSLQRLPQDTMDYLTMMLINEYAVNISQLIEKADSDEDREMLEDVLDSIGKALDHYKGKVH